LFDCEIRRTKNPDGAPTTEGDKLTVRCPGHTVESLIEFRNPIGSRRNLVPLGEQLLAAESRRKRQSDQQSEDVLPDHG
jgi:hypothetical protein